jgi:hypothetical protein
MAPSLPTARLWRCLRLLLRCCWLLFLLFPGRRHVGVIWGAATVGRSILLLSTALKPALPPLPLHWPTLEGGGGGCWLWLLELRLPGVLLHMLPCPGLRSEPVQCSCCVGTDRSDTLHFTNECA